MDIEHAKPLYSRQTVFAQFFPNANPFPYARMCYISAGSPVSLCNSKGSIILSFFRDNTPPPWLHLTFSTITCTVSITSRHTRRSRADSQNNPSSATLVDFRDLVQSKVYYHLLASHLFSTTTSKPCLLPYSEAIVWSISHACSSPSLTCPGGTAARVWSHIVLEDLH